MAAEREPKTSELRLLILAPATATIEQSKDETTEFKVNSTTTTDLFSVFLAAVTGTSPSKDLKTFAGYTSHSPLLITNKYYSANVNLWCDELPHTARPFSATDHDAETDAGWVTAMTSEEAKEVREVIGGIILLLPWSQNMTHGTDKQAACIKEYSKTVSAVNRVREVVEDESGRDIATIVVIQDMTPEASSSMNDAVTLQTLVEDLGDSIIADYDVFGWDAVAWQPVKRQQNLGSTDNTSSTAVTNQYGEKVGIERVLEVLEQTDWQAGVALPSNYDYHLSSIDDFLVSDDDSDNIGHDANGKASKNPKDPVMQQSDEFQREIMGLHFALEEQKQQETDTKPENDDELQVDQMMALMSRAAEIKAAGAEMSKDDRQRYAQREVQKLMREMKIG